MVKWADVRDHLDDLVTEKLCPKLVTKAFAILDGSAAIAATADEPARPARPASKLVIALQLAAVVDMGLVYAKATFLLEGDKLLAPRV